MNSTQNPGPNLQTPTPVSDSHNQDILPKDNNHRAKKDKEPTEKRVPDWLQFAVNSVLAVVGVIAICIYFGQLQVMKGQLGEIVKQYPEMKKQATAAQDQLTQAIMDSNTASIATAKQLQVFQGQLTEASKTRELTESQWKAQQRPWVGISDISFGNPQFSSPNPQFPVQLSLDFSYSLKNVGLSAATKVYPTFSILSVDKPGLPKIFVSCDLPSKNRLSESSLNTIFLMPEDKSPQTAHLMTNPERGGLFKTTSKIWVQVCVTYQDRFNSVYQTKMIYDSVSRDDSLPIAVPGHDFTYKPIVWWNLWSAETN
jgi:hypothetical protein